MWDFLAVLVDASNAEEFYENLFVPWALVVRYCFRVVQYVLCDVGVISGKQK